MKTLMILLLMFCLPFVLSAQEQETAQSAPAVGYVSIAKELENSIWNQITKKLSKPACAMEQEKMNAQSAQEQTLPRPKYLFLTPCTNISIIENVKS